MTDEPQLQVTRNSDASLILSKPRHGLIARGRRDAAKLRAGSALDSLLDTRRLAEAGYADAQFELGKAYHKGQGVPQDYAQALGWYRKAAEQDHLYAITNLGDMFGRGDGVTADRTEAQGWYRNGAEIVLFALGTFGGWQWDPDLLPDVFEKAAAGGYAEAQMVLGYANYRAKKYVEAVRWYREAAQQGRADAQCWLGLSYYRGEGVVQDYAEAVKWFHLAAGMGHAEAQNNLGIAHHYGHGVRRDNEESVKWYRSAAEQGHADAQYNLSAAYYTGRGVSQDYIQAHMWADLAAAASTGDEQNAYSSTREAIAAKMSPEQIAEAQRLAREWKPRNVSSETSRIANG